MTDTVQRANKPTQEFLRKIGIKSLPDNVDLVFSDRPQCQDSGRQTVPKFLVRKFDGARLVVEDSVNAYEQAGNSKDVIYGNLREKLTALGARPA